VGGERYFFCNEQNEKGEPVTWQGRQYQPYPIQWRGFELNGKGTSTRTTMTDSNLYGHVTEMGEEMQSLGGRRVVRPTGSQLCLGLVCALLRKKEGGAGEEGGRGG
ncbi:phage minor tail protein L, partial [Escherichia coli]|uniref:phage minor tail protein L n=1 Tax=Escherichia coli TaxID=562 RepID=UPI0010FA2C7A